MIRYQQLKMLKRSYLLLTILLILLQFYLISLKLPFDLTLTYKNLGFFSIYLNKLMKSFFLWPPLITFFLAHIVLQATLAIILYFLAKQYDSFSLGIFLWFAMQTIFYLLNFFLFPYSFFSILLANLHIPIFILKSLLVITSLFSLVIISIAVARLVFHKPFVSLSISIFIACLFIVSFLLQKYSSSQHFASQSQPNIVLIITDSLRPDYAHPNTSQTTKRPMRVQEFIRHAAFFENALTLLGRSTAGLVSILTGNYPKNSGARFNLLPSNYLHLEHSLTKVLKDAGYQTIFAADGLQFINVDKQFNFDQIITPKSGIYDFIFTLINDTPLTNLLMDTPVGEALFPYNYANRNSYYTYLPQSFINLVDNRLRNNQSQKPVLFIAALTIAHWPYVWGKQPNLPTLAERYEDSVIQLDQQFHQLLSLLQRRGILQNSIIVTLSDHGDSLGLPGDRIINPKNYIGDANRLDLISRFPYMSRKNKQLLGIDTSAGHGTDLLSMTQLHTTLAISYDHKIKPQVINERVALIDVMPTLLDLLKLTPPAAMDGISLSSLLKGENIPQLSSRPLFLESEIDIPLIDVTKQNQRDSSLPKLINRYADLYNIDPLNQRLILKESSVAALLTEKQRGVIYRDWLLVKFPGKNRLQTYLLPIHSPELKLCYYAFPADAQRIFCYRLSPTIPYYVLINLKTQKWQIYLEGEKSVDPVFNMLLGKLQQFYRNEEL